MRKPDAVRPSTPSLALALKFHERPDPWRLAGPTSQCAATRTGFGVLITFISATRKCTRHATSQNDTARHTQRCKESVDGERVPLPALARTHTRRRTRARTRTHMYIRTCAHLRTRMRTTAAMTHGGEGCEGVGRGCAWRGRRGCGPRLCAARAWAARAARVWAARAARVGGEGGGRDAQLPDCDGSAWRAQLFHVDV